MEVARVIRLNLIGRFGSFFVDVFLLLFVLKLTTLKVVDFVIVVPVCVKKREKKRKKDTTTLEKSRR